MYYTWTLIADLTAGALQLRASKFLGFIPGVEDGVWASVAGVGDTKRPPEWMQKLSEQLERDGIKHEIY